MAVTVDTNAFNYRTDTIGPMEAITPTDDTAILIRGKYPRRIYVGTAGDLTVYDITGAAVTLSNMPAGVHVIPYTGVAATDTTASDLVAIG